jgi:hypothetical protein
MKAALLYVNLLLASLLAGCSDSGQQADSAAGEVKPQNVWQEQVETMDKARQVEQRLLDARQSRDEQLEKQQ